MTALNRLRLVALSAMLFMLGACASSGELHSQMPKTGWKHHTAADAEFWLPVRFMGGDMQRALPEMLKQLDDLGPEYRPFIERIKAHPEVFKFFVIDPDTNDNVIISTGVIPPTLDLKALARQLARLTPNVTLKSQQALTINGLEAMRLVWSQKPSADLTVMQEVYLIKRGKTLWTVVYSTVPASYKKNKAMFAMSIASFQVQAR